MTRNEFNQLLAVFAERFPDDNEWVVAHRQTAELWYTEIFADLPLADCLDQLRQIFIGKAEKWQAWQRDQIGAIIARPVRRKLGELSEHERMSSVVREDASKMRRNKSGGVNGLGSLGSLAAAYQRACKLRENGASEEEIQATIDEAFGLGANPRGSYE